MNIGKLEKFIQFSKFFNVQSDLAGLNLTSRKIIFSISHKIKFPTFLAKINSIKPIRIPMSHQ